MPIVFLNEPPGAVSKRPLTEDDAVDIWMARWLRIRPRDLVRRYQCDPRRLYEIWAGDTFPASRAKARQAFKRKYPALLDRIDFGHHRRISTGPGAGQLSLFE